MAKSAAERMREMRMRKRLATQVGPEVAKEVVAQTVSLQEVVDRQMEERWEAFETGQAALRFSEAQRTGDRSTLARVRTWLQDSPHPLLWLAEEWLSRQGLGGAWSVFVEESGRPA